MSAAKKRGERVEQDEAVNHPAHYNAHPSGVECIDIVEHFTFNVGNTIKYCWRAGLKHQANTGPLSHDAAIEVRLEDLKKGRWYLDREIERLESRRGT